MKVICLFLMLSSVCFGHLRAHNIQHMTVVNDCFSAANFDLVYDHIRESISQGNLGFYTHQTYQLHPGCSAEIAVKQDGYTLAIISRGKGVYSLAKVLSDNHKLVSTANRIFCEVLEKAGG